MAKIFHCFRDGLRSRRAEASQNAIPMTRLLEGIGGWRGLKNSQTFS
jgi:hypothetical protein